MYNELLLNAKALIVKDEKNHYTCYREENDTWFLYDDSKKYFEAINNINKRINKHFLYCKEIIKKAQLKKIKN